MRTIAHIFRPVSACPLHSPICVHATVQSVAIKSDSGRRNICKTLSRFLLAFICSPRRHRPLSRCGYLHAARPISAKYKCVIRRTRPISVEYKCIIKELVRQHTGVCVCDCAICVAIMRYAGNLIRYLFPDGRAISYHAHDQFGGPDYAKSNFCIKSSREIRDRV